MKFFALALVLAVASAATPPQSDLIGLRVAISNQGVKRVENIAIPLVVKALQDIKIPGTCYFTDHVVAHVLARQVVYGVCVCARTPDSLTARACA